MKKTYESFLYFLTFSIEINKPWHNMTYCDKSRKKTLQLFEKIPKNF
jgi:hypothetical protein